MIKGLIVNDNLNDQIDIRSRLHHLITFETVMDGRSAISRISQRDYDIIFLDIQIPGASGYEVIENMDRESKCKTIVLLNKGNTGLKTNSMLKGGVSFLDFHAPASEIESLMKKLGIID